MPETNSPGEILGEINHNALRIVVFTLDILFESEVVVRNVDRKSQVA